MKLPDREIASIVRLLELCAVYDFQDHEPNDIIAVITVGKTRANPRRQGQTGYEDRLLSDVADDLVLQLQALKLAKLERCWVEVHAVYPKAEGGQMEMGNQEIFPEFEPVIPDGVDPASWREGIPRQLWEMVIQNKGLDQVIGGIVSMAASADAGRARSMDALETLILQHNTLIKEVFESQLEDYKELLEEQFSHRRFESILEHIGDELPDMLNKVLDEGISWAKSKHGDDSGKALGIAQKAVKALYELVKKHPAIVEDETVLRYLGGVVDCLKLETLQSVHVAVAAKIEKMEVAASEEEAPPEKGE